MIAALVTALSLPGLWVTWALLRPVPVDSLMADAPAGGPDYYHAGDDWTGYV